MKIHDLKSHLVPFSNVLNYEKGFEYRKNDRDFQPGDWLILNEWNPKSEEYTGSVIIATVGYIEYGPAHGIPDGFCVMDIGVSMSHDVDAIEEE